MSKAASRAKFKKNHFLDLEEVTEAPLREDLSSCIKKHLMQGCSHTMMKQTSGKW